MIQLSQSKLAVWQTCKRKFQLRYVEKSEWPLEPFAEESTQAMEMGEMFHMLVAQHMMLGSEFAVSTDQLGPPLNSWWLNFLETIPTLVSIRSADRFRVETSLAAPINEQFKLFGRIDLLVTNEDSIEIFDWKTGRPRSKIDLEEDWQTRIYLALLYQSRLSLGLNIAADQLSMTYWYAREPKNSVKIFFNEDWHKKNWDELVAVANKISDQLDSNQTIWSLTDDKNVCGRCAFSALCGREPANQLNDSADFEELEIEELSDFELADTVVHPDI
ncbi:MAG: PD-(D/E)XK nuclease family protein [Anaerolineae bacterium]